MPIIADLAQFREDQQTGNLSYSKGFIEFIRHYPDGSQIAVTWNFTKMTRSLSMYDVITDTTLTSIDEWPIVCTWEAVEALYQPSTK